MPKRVSSALSARFVESVKDPGLYLDGNGLYLAVSESSAREKASGGPLNKSWLLRYKFGGKVRDMGLGSLRIISLSEARDKTKACRSELLDGIDPLEAREAKKIATQLDKSRNVTFQHCADTFIKSHKAAWKNEKHCDQWKNTLKTYAYPFIGNLPVAKIDTPEVTQVLEPIWEEKTETANRLRGRIEKILDWATVKKYRTGSNPARWRGNLDHVFLPRSKVAPVEHHAALPYDEIFDFMRSLRAQEGVAPRALEFIILTACRTSEALGATWDEIDVANKIWNIPKERMKAGVAYKVPLPDSALRIIRAMKEIRDGDFVFPGGKKGEPLSNMACLAILKRMERSDLTTHGFRSTFRDWCAEKTAFPNFVAEMALAHKVKGVEGDYRRGDLLEKRRELMQQWARFCDMPAKAKGQVINIRRR